MGRLECQVEKCSVAMLSSTEVSQRAVNRSSLQTTMRGGWDFWPLSAHAEGWLCADGLIDGMAQDTTDPAEVLG